MSVQVIEYDSPIEIVILDGNTRSYTLRKPEVLANPRIIYVVDVTGTGGNITVNGPINGGASVTITAAHGACVQFIWTGTEFTSVGKF